VSEINWDDDGADFDTLANTRRFSHFLTTLTAQV